LSHLASTGLFLGVLVLVGMALLVWGGRGFPAQPMSFVRGPLGFAEVAIIALVFSSIGAFLVRRLPSHAVGWSLMLIGIGVALHLPASLMVEAALGSFRPVPPMLVVGVWALTSAFVPLAVSLITYLLLVLPDGRALPGRRWRGAMVMVLLGFHVLTAATALEPTGLVWFPTLPNPLGIPQSMGPAVGVLRLVGVGFMVLAVGLGAVAMTTRYRRCDPVTRRQLAWVAFGGVVWATALAPFVIVRYLLHVSDDVGTVFTGIAAAGTIAFPIAIYVATLRYHLFGVEAILGRTLVYVPLMGICGGLYAAGLAFSQRIFVAVTGNTSDVAIIVATLLMAAAFTPARRALEVGVERMMAARNRGGVETKHAGNAAETTAAEYERLVAEAAHFSARLAEVEHQIAALEEPHYRDLALEAGEPGVGRVARRGAGEPGLGLHAGEPRPGRA